MKALSVALTRSFSLEAGVFGEEGDTIVIQPPPVAMFDQLLDWLHRQMPPDPSTFHPTRIGIGATCPWRIANLWLNPKRFHVLL